jgi:hypothetical protein
MRPSSYSSDGLRLTDLAVRRGQPYLVPPERDGRSAAAPAVHVQGGSDALGESWLH